jgi:alpha-ketoglutarate-dependent 2,4-dichlorophenoxyacetate dioxygenase
MIEVKQIHPLFVGEVSGVDLSGPLDGETYDALESAINRHAVLVFHDQHIDDERQIAFSERLGSLATTSTVLRPGYKGRLDPRMSDISNLDTDNRVMARDNRRRMQALANRFWHTDNAFRAVSAKFSLLSARVIPSEGGETEFADMRAAYDALPDKTKALLESKTAVHSIIHSRRMIGFDDYSPEEREGLPDARHPMVKTHPATGRKALYLASYAHEIDGMPTPEARMVLHDLIEHATQRRFVYTHQWRVGDLVMWDNRCTMHRARPYDLSVPRDLHRTTVRDVAPAAEAAGAA